MNLVAKSLLWGCGLTAAFLALGELPEATRGPLKIVQQSIEYLLAPGILAGFALGSGRVHDLGFWCFTILLNCLFYSVLACILYDVRRRLTAPHSR
jgi:hypothetical protein